MIKKDKIIAIIDALVCKKKKETTDKQNGKTVKMGELRY